MVERVFYALITVLVGVVLIYIIRRIRDAVYKWKHMPVDKFFLDTQGEYRDVDGFDMDGYGAVQADGYCYDRWGRDKDGIHYETGLDEAGYRRDGFSEYGFHKENGSRYNPLTGLDINGVAVA